MPNEVQSSPLPEICTEMGGRACSRTILVKGSALPSELSLSTVGESKGNVDVQFRTAGLLFEAGLSRPTQSIWLLLGITSLFESTGQLVSFSVKCAVPGT